MLYLGPSGSYEIKTAYKRSKKNVCLHVHSSTCMIHFVYWNREQAWDEESGNVASSFGSGYELTAMI